MSSKIKNRKAHSQAREIIWNVFKYFKDKNEYMANCRLYTTTAEATGGYSTMSIKRIVYEVRKTWSQLEILHWLHLSLLIKKGIM